MDTPLPGTIDELWPTPRSWLTDEQLLELYAPPSTPWLRMNFISSLDGAATRNGRSGELGDDADRRVFELLRQWADVVLLGAGTARIEGYGSMRVSPDAAIARERWGLAAQPVLALVSGSLALDPESSIFTDAPRRPLIYTTAQAPSARRVALERVATVVTVGEAEVDPAAVRRDLITRGHVRIHSEGGPTLYGTFIAADIVDELCLTLAPTLESGDAPRIAHGVGMSTPRAMTLTGVLRSNSELLLRYRRMATTDDARDTHHA